VVPASNTYTFGSTGTYYFWAVYSGDDNNVGNKSGCDTEIVVVNPNEATITTQVKNSAGDQDIANGANVAIGTVAYDTAGLSGVTVDAGGTVTYYVEKGDSSCTLPGATSLGTVDVAAGVVPASTTYTFDSAGGYYFWAVYSGDGNNLGATSGCNTEVVVVDKNPSEISTAQNLIPNDQATLTGLTVNAGGTITFELYSPSDLTCAKAPAYQETVTVTGNGTYGTSNSKFIASAVGTWKWLVSYSGDDNNTGSTSACGVENFTITNQ
jgi:hypothetical protein